MKSRYELATKSIYSLKEERIESALTYVKMVEKELPNTEYAKTASDLKAKLEKEKEHFAVVKKKLKQKLQL